MISASPSSTPIELRVEASRVFDGSFWLAMMICLGVMAARGSHIVLVQSSRVDDGYHLHRGLLYLTHKLPEGFYLNDPPLGEALSAVPLLFNPRLWPIWSITPEVDVTCREPLMVAIAIWKSLLFLPMAGIIFHWLRKLYGRRTAWLGIALLLIEPSIAAHTPVPTIDMLGAEAIVIGSFISWRYFEKPTLARLIAMSVAVPAAVMIKHTAVIFPAVVGAMAVLWWVVKPLKEGRKTCIRVKDVGLGVLIGLLALWALTWFDISHPRLPDPWKAPGHPIAQWMHEHSLPAGSYIGCFMEGMSHAREGHPGILFGEMRGDGWWYYFPAIATMKIPLGLWLVILLGCVSVVSFKPKWEEWSIFLPLLAWTVMSMSSPINIGFRHFLPSLVLMLMLATRVMAAPGRIYLTGAVVGMVVAAIHACAFHPDYLSYVNRPIDRPWIQMSDSNIDWGQAQKQVRRWVDEHVPEDRPVTLAQFGWEGRDWLGPRIAIVEEYRNIPAPGKSFYASLPTRGVFIVSPNWVTGQYDGPNFHLKKLREIEPKAIIGHSMLVYDLDELSGGKGFEWK